MDREICIALADVIASKPAPTRMRDMLVAVGAGLPAMDREICIALADVIAGKPAPTGLRFSFEDFAHAVD
jgi:hypothetical protein